MSKISAMTAAGTLDGTELVETVQSGATRRTTTAAIGGLGGGVYPWQVDVDVLMTPPLNVGSWVNAQRSYIYGGIIYNSAGAQGNNAGWDVVLAAGTWTLEVIRYNGTDAGKETWALDDGAGTFTDLGTIDDYSASNGGDLLASVTGIVVGSTIKRRLRVTAAPKNAASIGHYLRIQHVQLRRTA